MEFSEQELVRRDKLKKIRDLGIDPYPAELFPVSDYSIEIKNNFQTDKKVVISGRLMSRRIQGNASFAELQDSKVKSNSTLTEMKFVLEKIKFYIMNYIKNYLT